MPKRRSNRPNVESLIPDVDDDMRGDRSSAPDDDASSDEQDDMSARRQDDTPSSRQDDTSMLAQQLAVLMEGPRTPHPSTAPDLKARANGYLSEDVERALQQATAVLKNSHGKVSKSMIIDYAIRVLLWDLKENAEDSQLVQWLEELDD